MHRSLIPTCPSPCAIPCTCSQLAVALRSFVSRGGVLLLTASSNSNLANLDAACSAPMAIINVVLQTSGCSCVSVSAVPGTHGAPYASVSAANATATWGSDATELIFAQPPSYRLSVSAVGGLPMQCPAGPAAGYGVFPVSWTALPGQASEWCGGVCYSECAQA